VKASGDRNEALDCLVYAYATLQWVARRYNRATMWDQLERHVNAAISAPVTAQPAPTDSGRKAQRTPRINPVTTW
jgi:phage terminase large subunit GpA-like protein